MKRWIWGAAIVLAFAGCKDRKRPPRAPSSPVASGAAESATEKPKPPALPSATMEIPKPAARAGNGPSPRPWKVAPGPGDCEDCHPDEVEGFAKTGMGRSWYPPKKYPPIEDFDPKKATVVHPLTKVVYKAFIDEAGRWWQSESVPGTDYEKRVEVKYVVGSGNATRSYIGEVENQLVELPLTWYVGKGIWDMSPGYEGKGHARFSRPIQAPCMFCHNDLSPLRDETMAGYHDPVAEGISCTRCHGDGSEHVRTRNDGKGPPEGAADETIVNPARLPPEQQLQMCQQCHLAGKMRVLHEGKRWDEYDIRTPLDQYMSIYIDADDTGPKFGIASHGKRLSLSKCFIASAGKLSCTRCHNPHELNPTLSKHDACVGCHEPTDCGDEHGAAAGKDCARCHMPHQGTSDIPHVTFTDHFIRKDPKNDKPDPVIPSPVVRLVDALAPKRDDDASRMRLGIAHAELARNNDDVRHAQAAVPLLRQGLSKNPEYVEAWWQLARLLAKVGDLDGAIAAFREVEARKPQGVLHRLDMANAFERMGRFKEAEGLLKAAVKLRPDYREAWGNLANNYQRQGRLADAEALYADVEAAFPGLVSTANNRGYNAIQREKWDEAQTWFEAALKRDATNPMGYFNLGTLALKRGDKVAARGHFRDALRRDPEFALAHWLIGRLARQDGDLGQARESLEAATAKNPDNPVMYLDLAQVHFEAGAFERARDTLMRGSLASPQSPVLGEALRRLTAGLPPLPKKKAPTPPGSEAKTGPGSPPPR